MKKWSGGNLNADGCGVAGIGHWVAARAEEDQV